MDTRVFLTWVLPSQGFYFLASSNSLGLIEQRQNRPDSPHFFWTIDDLLAEAEAIGASRRSPHFALASFKHNEFNPTGSKGGQLGRTKANSKAHRCAFFDMDVSEGDGDPHHYGSLKGALEALKLFVAATSLPAPLVVLSGSGLHVYFPFDEDLPPDQWAPIARGLKAALVKHGVKTDTTKTADASAMLRVPGFVNQKRASDTKVIAEGAGPQPVSAFHWLTKLDGEKVGISARAAKKGGDWDPTFAEIMSANCAQVGWFKQAGGEWHEGFGHHVLSNINKCEDKEIADDWCQGDRYNGEWVAGQLAREDDPPSGCDVIRSHSPQPNLCNSCPHFSKVKNPLGVARRSYDTTDPEYDPDYIEYEKTTTGKWKNGNANNTMKALRRLRSMGRHTFRWDSFHHICLIDNQPASDAMVGAIRFEILREPSSPGMDCGKEMLHDCLGLLCREMPYHPLLDWIDRLHWDGQLRLEEAFIRALNCDDTPYHRMVSRRFHVAAIRRLRKPGCVFDCTVVTEGYQNHGKSTYPKVMANGMLDLPDNPLNNYYCDATHILDSKGRETIEQLSDAWWIELGEMASQKRTENDLMKSFMSRQEDKGRMAFEREVERRARQCVFFGTTNELVYLKDGTGGRRWWPVRCNPWKNPTAQKAAWAWLLANREQILAEASHYEKLDEPLTMPQNLWDAARAEQKKRRVVDYWEIMLGERYASKSVVSPYEAFGVLGVDNAMGVNQAAMDRLIRTMQTIGFEFDGDTNSFKRIGGNEPSNTGGSP